jgi:hypothetical protein
MPWEVPLTYLPLTWLSFAPAVLAGVDLRWTSTACELALFAVLLRTAGGPRNAASAPVSLLFAAWFPASTLVASDTLTTMPVQSLALGASMALVAIGSRAAPVAVGLALATTPLAVPLLPLVLLRWWQNGTRSAVRKIAVAAAVAAVVVLPWAMWSPHEFWGGTFRWFNDLDGFPRRMSQAWVQVAGFTGTFWRLGWQRMLRPVQGALVLAVAGLYARRSRGGHSEGSDWLGAAAATLLAFLLFNVIAWPYLYEPVAVLALAAVAVRARRVAAT